MANFVAAIIRRWLTTYGEPVRARIQAVPATDLALQRLRFVPRLMMAAGYAGWIVLVDEVELMAKYSRLQRARSYAALARILNANDVDPYVGVTSVAAITPDYETHVLYGSPEDLTRIPELLKGRPGDIELLPGAEEGMRLIRDGCLDLARADARLLQETYGKIKRIYAEAYGWNPPELPFPTIDTSTRFRQYVKAWITAWDLRRLDPSSEPRIQVEPVRPIDFAEDPDLASTEEEELSFGVKE